MRRIYKKQVNIDTFPVTTTSARVSLAFVLEPSQILPLHTIFRIGDELTYINEIPTRPGTCGNQFCLDGVTL